MHIHLHRHHFASLSIYGYVCVYAYEFLGAYPSPLLYANFPKSCCTSINQVVCHGIPDLRPLEDGKSTYTYTRMHATCHSSFFVFHFVSHHKLLPSSNATLLCSTPLYSSLLYHSTPLTPQQYVVLLNYTISPAIAIDYQDNHNHCLSSHPMLCYAMLCYANRQSIQRPTPLHMTQHILIFHPHCTVLYCTVLCSTAGDILNIDISAYKNSYHGDCSGMYTVGHVDSTAEKLLRVTKECVYKAIAICAANVPLNRIGQVIEEHAAANGFKIVKQFCGMSVLSCTVISSVSHSLNHFY
jgi:hypothetical protein